MGWGALLLIFQEKKPHIKNFKGRILTGEIWGVFLYVYVLFFALDKLCSAKFLLGIPYVFCVEKGPSINFLGPGQRFFAGGSPTLESGSKSLCLCLETGIGGGQIQKNPRVRKISVRNSGAGNGCANFMDARKNVFFLQEKNPCP